jgi:hypothetical protein
VRLIHAVVTMREPADIVNVNLGLGDHAFGADRLNLIHQSLQRSPTVMHKRNFAFVLCRDAFRSSRTASQGQDG